MYGLGIGLSYALVALLTGRDSQALAGLWHGAMQTASWLTGLGALSLARDLDERDARSGLLGLTRLRGFDRASLERARWLAGAITLSSVTTAAGGLLAVAAMLKLRSVAGAALALAMVPLTLVYGAVVGSVLAALARLSARSVPGKGRWALLIIVLVPWLADIALGGVRISIPGWFGWLLQRLTRVLG
jgi:hypothetical protein